MEASAHITIERALEKLGMDASPSSGLRWVSDKREEQNPYAYLALEQAGTVEATAVYFRFFNDDRPPRPQVYIYSFNNLDTAISKGADIHHHLWNAGVVPFAFIYGGSEILVYNCGERPEISNSEEEFVTYPHDIIHLLSEIQEEFDKYSARQFDSGLFWDSEERQHFKYDNSAYEQLLEQLKKVKSNIISRVGQEKSALVKRILMMLVLIKYLEERIDENGKGALHPDDFYKEFNAENPTLEGILNNVDTFVDVLNNLSRKEHFNGQIFLLDKDELSLLKAIDLDVFKFFVRGDVSFFSEDNQGIGQMSLWRLYQFNYLPIELISHIYEDFLADENGQKKKGVVYTPPYLVQFLIDRCMPLNAAKEHFKILDPACGSGIFLVGAFKRMIQWWRVRNNWAKPTKDNIDELKQLLLNNVFGCDLEGEAVTLSYFSLGLALLDALSPKEIWNNVHFDNLIETNLFSGDFFKTLHEKKLSNNFDLVIGNPPFNSEFTEWAKIIDCSAKVENPERPVVPDNQIALLFLEQSFSLLRDGGNCCLILPSGPVLYNTKTHDFRKYLFEQNYFKEIYDFTALRATLFTGSSSSAKPAVVTIFAQKCIPDGKQSIQHLIFRRTKASGEKIEFEIDHYDIHIVAYKAALSVSGVWQANFMGGGRLHKLLERIDAEVTLGSYLDEMVAIRGWKVAEGWIESPNAKSIQRIQFLLAKEELTHDETDELNALESKHKADWITGFNFVETEDFTEHGIKATKPCTIGYFYRSAKTNKEIFRPPHLLIKEQSGTLSIPIEFRDDYLTFRNEIIGISAPSSDIDLLRTIEKRIRGNISYSALLWLLSGRIITTREGVVLKNDILSLPYSEKEFCFSSVENILLEDIANHYSNFRKEGEKSEILNIASIDVLKSFGKMYCLILNTVFKNFRPLTPIVGKDFVAYPIVLGDNPEIEIPDSIEDIENNLRMLIDNNAGYNLWIKRIIKVYCKNVVFLYKPNQKRYWLQSIAIRDADETFLDLFNQGK